MNRRHANAGADGNGPNWPLAPGDATQRPAREATPHNEKKMKTKTVKRRASGSNGRPAKLWQLRLYVAGQTPKSLTLREPETDLREHLKDAIASR